MDTETKQEALSAENETASGHIEIQAGPAHVLGLMFLLGAAIFVAGFGWWTLSNMAKPPKTIAALRAEMAEVRPAAGPETARPAVPATAPLQPARQMALPPVRQGFEPKPEATSVKGDPKAPVTIVEFSDYQ